MLELITDAISRHSLLATGIGAAFLGVIQNIFWPVVRVALLGGMLAVGLIVLRFAGDAAAEDNIPGHLLLFGGVYFVVVALPYMIRGRLPSLDKLP